MPENPNPFLPGAARERERERETARPGLSQRAVATAKAMVASGYGGD